MERDVSMALKIILPAVISGLIILAGCEEQTPPSQDGIVQNNAPAGEPAGSEQNNDDALTDDLAGFDLDIEQELFRNEKELFLENAEIQLENLGQARQSLSLIARDDMVEEFYEHIEAMQSDLDRGRELVEQARQADLDSWGEIHEQFHDNLDSLIEHHQQAAELLSQQMRRELEQMENRQDDIDPIDIDIDEQAENDGHVRSTYENL